MCNEEKLCNAFEYDGGSKSCKINHDPNPNRKKFFNWFFCQKESNNFFIHNVLNTKSNHYNLLDYMTKFRSCKSWFVEISCSPGYKKISGSFAGSGGLEGALNSYDVGECADLCASRPDCYIFQYSRDRQLCKLHKAGTPASSTTYQDFSTCAKGTLPFYQTWDTIYYDFLKVLKFQ